MKNKVLSLLMVAAMTVGMLAGCGSKTDAPADNTIKEETPATEAVAEPATEEASESEIPTELEHIKVAYMPNYASLATIVAAEGTGAFEKYGFDVELVEFADGPTIISAMESGSIDYAYIGTGAHKLCIQGRADVICFAQLSNADAVIGNTDKGVNTVEDLKGKKVAYSSGTSSEEILKATLGKANLTLDDIEAVEMDASAITTAMVSGKVDACATWSPNTLTIYNELGDKAVELGANKDFTDTNVSVSSFIAMPDKVEMDASAITTAMVSGKVDACATWSPNTLTIYNELGDKAVELGANKDFTDTNVSVSSFIAMPDKVENNRDQVIRFVEAMYAGSDFRNTDFDQNCQYAADLTGLSIDSMTGSKLDADWVDAATIHELANNGEMLKYYEIQQKNFLESGAVEEEVPVENYVHFDIMNEAYDAYTK